VRDLRPVALTWASRKLGTDEAEDIAQDAVTEVIRALQDGTLERGSERQLRSYVRKLVHMRSLDHLAAMQARDRRDEAFGMEQLHTTRYWENPEDDTRQRDRQQAVRSAVEALPPRLRNVMLKRLDGYNTADTAIALGIAEQTVKNCTSQGMRLMEVPLTPYRADPPGTASPESGGEVRS
jgi:RNA polymerase sigma-70 factor (ECF subfamily)